MDVDEQLEDSVKILERQIKAKKAILEEVVQSVDNSEDKANSVKRRNYIRDVLSCELSYSCSENNVVSVNSIDYFQFEGSVISLFNVLNRLDNGDLSVQVSTSSADCLIRWSIFEHQTSLNQLSSASPQECVVLCVAVPLSAFYLQDKVSIIVRSKSVPSKCRLLTPAMYSSVGANQTPIALPEAIVSVTIDVSEAIEKLDLKSLEFADESKAVRLMQALLTVFHQLPISLDFSIFRRTFPRFSSMDFDTWRLFIGNDRYEGLVLYTRTEDDTTTSRVIGADASICRKFFKVANEACFGN